MSGLQTGTLFYFKAIKKRTFAILIHGYVHLFFLMEKKYYMGEINEKQRKR